MSHHLPGRLVPVANGITNRCRIGEVGVEGIIDAHHKDRRMRILLPDRRKEPVQLFTVGLAGSLDVPADSIG